MQLREHPLMTVRGICSWPPAWVRLGRTHAKAPKTFTGETGVLKEVRYYPDRRGRIYLTIVHEGAIYVGCLLLDDEVFCEKLAEHLRRCYGMALDAVGSSELA